MGREAARTAACPPEFRPRGGCGLDESLMLQLAAEKKQFLRRVPLMNQGDPSAIAKGPALNID